MKHFREIACLLSEITEKEIPLKFHKMPHYMIVNEQTFHGKENIVKINRITMQKILNSKRLNVSDLRKDGISSVTLAKIARGEEVRPSTVIKIAELLDADPDALVEMDPFYSYLRERYETAARRI